MGTNCGPVRTFGKDLQGLMTDRILVLARGCCMTCTVMHVRWGRCGCGFLGNSGCVGRWESPEVLRERDNS